LESAEKTGRLLIVHQANTTGGFGAEIVAMVAQEGFEFLISPIRRLGALDVPVPFSPVLENYVVPDETRIVEEVINMMNQ
jgi:pyruvate dehydrogenase E1 component beta subunit